ncbi:MAG: spermidine synthase [Oceanospirillaceae bacterium]|nr:spermidine synthase [Oceanospirillaceae bacterium]
MGLMFEELDYRTTPIGDLRLRRRRMAQFGDLDIFEIILGDNFLMTSLFHESEDQLSIIGLADLAGDNLDVVVGGLGLGYTAAAALDHDKVGSLVVVDYLQGVIDWHERHLVPMSERLTADPRCQFVHGDFFALSKDTNNSYEVDKPDKKYHAILLDIDHTPTHVLNPNNLHLYTEQGLSELASHLKPAGVFALWSDGHPVDSFVDQLNKVFSNAKAHLVEFDNPVTGGSSVGTVYVSLKRAL